MSSAPPLLYHWADGAMRPLGRFAKLAAQWFKPETIYKLVAVEDAERSAKSHRAYFAAVNTAFANLPEHYGLAFPSADHLRKWALIKAGYCDIKKLTGKGRKHIAIDRYAVVTLEDGVTTVYTAQSQSYQAMGKKAFHESTEAVLEVLAQMTNTTPDQLRKERSA